LNSFKIFLLNIHDGPKQIAKQLEFTTVLAFEKFKLMFLITLKLIFLFFKKSLKRILLNFSNACLVETKIKKSIFFFFKSVAV